MILFFLFFSTSEITNFYVDPVVYQSPVDSLFYIEFNCATPYHELYFQEVNNKIIAQVTVEFKFFDLMRHDSLVDTLYRQFTIPSFSEAARQQMSFIIQFGLYIPEGKFEYVLNTSSGIKKGLIVQKIEVIKEMYKISDLLLASNIRSDTTQSYLRKGNLIVVPHPSHQFDEHYSNLYVYYEIYDPPASSDSLEIIYKIVNEAKKIIRKITRRVDKRFKTQAVNFGVNIQGLESGAYIFMVEVKNPNTQAIARKEIPFDIIKTAAEEISYEGLPYYEEIEYFVTSEQYKYFQNLPKDGKAMFFERFWETHNYWEISGRFDHADKYYRQGDRPGYKTDRGRIYVKYGEPDEIERSIIEYYEARPYEHWQYSNGAQFLFLDIRGTNEYTLVWTNVSGEQSQPTLYKYIPPNKSELVK